MSSVVSSIFGGSSGGSAPAPLSQSQTDPFGANGGRTVAADQLKSYMADPSLALSSPGYQQQLQKGMDQSNAAAAATGTLQSGGQSNALQAQGQNTFASYYQNAINNLTLQSGANQSPAQAGQVQYGSEASSANIQNSLNAQSAQNMIGLSGLMNGASSSGLFKSMSSLFSPAGYSGAFVDVGGQGAAADASIAAFM